MVRSLRQLMPEAAVVYVADSAHAPYGDRDSEFVLNRTRRIVQHLLDEGAQVIAIACNTATAVAAEVLRRENPGLLIVGVEPGIKPAVASTRNGRIGVLATTLTLASARFQDLLARHGHGVAWSLQACPGLADCIEDAASCPSQLDRLVERYTAPMREQHVDTVVLGCTHYPLIAPQIQQALGRDVALIDTSEAVARQIVRLAESAKPLPIVQSEPIRLWTTTTSSTALRAAASRWLDEALEVTCLN